MPRRALVLALTVALVACSNEATSPPRPVLGEPITGLVQDTWTWVDFPDSACDDGSPTGIGVSLGSGPDVLVFMEGGGACWNYATCVTYRGQIAAAGPFGQPQFDVKKTELAGSIFDRSVPSNPFKSSSFVYVPYCTGDVHSGSNVVEYTDPTGAGAPSTYHHVGHENVLAYLKRVAATFPSPGKLVVSGSSAGGFGALVNYDTFRTYWPTGQLSLVDDSGPPLPGAQVKAQLDTFDPSWKLYQLLDTFCTECRTDITKGLTSLARRHPADRMSLLSWETDTVIPFFFLLSEDAFVSLLLQTAHGTINPLANAKYFLVGGTTATTPLNRHTVLGHPGDFSVDGVGLWQFLDQQVNDTPGWASHAAP
ncbi:MAG TPA: pectin acetylesterase-family hydrolase [Anaeromyxobacteraceae bacterium]